MVYVQFKSIQLDSFNSSVLLAVIPRDSLEVQIFFLKINPQQEIFFLFPRVGEWFIPEPLKGRSYCMWPCAAQRRLTRQVDAGLFHRMYVWFWHFVRLLPHDIKHIAVRTQRAAALSEMRRLWRHALCPSCRIWLFFLWFQTANNNIHSSSSSKYEIAYLQSESKKKHWRWRIHSKIWNSIT